MRAGIPRTRGLRVALAIVLLGEAYLLLSGRRLLIWERKVEVGERYVAGEWGDLGRNQAPSLVCRYFNGRRVLLTVYWYSEAEILGRSVCPPTLDAAGNAAPR